jgi:hypothetical protein
MAWECILKLINNKKATTIATNTVIQWIIAGIILVVVMLAIIGPTGMKEAFDTLNKKFNIWEPEEPGTVVTPPTPIDNYKELIAAFANQNKFILNKISKNQMKEVFLSANCIENYDVHGKKTYLVKSKVNGKDAYLIYFPYTYLGMINKNKEYDDVEKIIYDLNEMISTNVLYSKIEVMHEPNNNVKINEIINYCRQSSLTNRPDFDVYCNEIDFNKFNDMVTIC